MSDDTIIPFGRVSAPTAPAASEGPTAAQAHGATGRPERRPEDLRLLARKRLEFERAAFDFDTRMAAFEAQWNAMCVVAGDMLDAWRAEQIRRQRENEAAAARALPPGATARSDGGD